MMDTRKRGGRSFGSALFAVALGAICQPVVAETALFGRFDNQLVSEPEPIKATLKDWGDEFDEGEQQWSVNHAEIGVRYNGFELSVQQRALADLRMNEAAVAYWGQLNRKEELEPGTRVPVEIRVNGFTARGLRLGYRLQSDNGWLGVGGTLLQASHLIAGGLNGEFESLADSDYDFSADVDYAYHRDVIFGRPDVDEASGIGWSFDLAGEWQPDEHWTFRFRAEDLFARIRWRDAPYTVAQADTRTKSYDGDGYAVFDPILTGTEGYRDSFYQELDPRYKGSVALSEGDWSAHLRGQYQFGYGFAGIGAGRMLGDQTEIRALYWPRLETVGIELEAGDWLVALSVDSPQWQRVRSLGLTLSKGY
jgi:hypothetical protein